MSQQEKAGIKALARHSQKMGIRNGQINCLCGWKTETTGQVSQRKSFRRHQMREVLVAIKKASQPDPPAWEDTLHALHHRVSFTWVNLDGTDGRGYICNECTPLTGTSLVFYPCDTIKIINGDSLLDDLPHASAVAS